MSDEKQVNPQSFTGPDVRVPLPPVVREKTPVAQMPANASPLDLPTAVFAEGLDRRKTNRAALMGWVREALVDGVDFGRIHVVPKKRCPHGNQCLEDSHWSKPSLFKPGAEKICGMLGVKVRFPALNDYEVRFLAGESVETIMLRCELTDGAGTVVASGVGARAVSKDYGDVNKALKMAEKSAHIDATLRLAGLSEIFGQDLEDINPEMIANACATPRGADWDALIAEAQSAKELGSIRRDLEEEWRRIGVVWKARADEINPKPETAEGSFADRVRGSK